MAERYRSNFRPQVQAQAGSFNPETIGSRESALKEEAQRQKRYSDDFLAQIKENQEQELQNIRTENANAQQLGKDIESLGQFSQTLARELVEIQEKRNQGAMQRGLAKAYEDGLPQKQVEQFDQEEAELQATDSLAKEAAWSAQEQGMSASTARQIRNLSGWEGYGYAKGMAEQGALGYGSFLEGAKRDRRISIEDKDGNVKEISYAEADTVAEQKAWMAAARQEYLSQFAGMNPVMLNKYLFPAMKREEAKMDLQWEADQTTKLETERKDQAYATLISGKEQGNLGAAVMDILNNRPGDFGGDAGARKAVKELLETGIKNGVFTTADIQQLMGYTFTNRAEKEVTFGDQFGREFGSLEQLSLDQGLKISKNDEKERQIRGNQLEAELREMLDGRDNKLLTDAEKKAFLEKWDDEVGLPRTSFLDGLITQEQQADDELEDHLLNLIASRPGGYLLESDLRGASTELYLKYKDKVVQNPTLSGYDTQVKQGEKEVDAALREIAPLTGDGKFTNQAAVQASYYGKQMFRSLFAENLKTMPADQALRKAMEDVKPMLTVPPGKRLEDLPILGMTSSGDSDRAQANTNSVALQAVGADPTIITTGVIPGTEKDLEKLVTYAETGKGSIPEVYRILAANSNGKYSAWDIAESQLQATGKGTLFRRPPAEQAVKDMPPDMQRLLNFRPTGGRTYRAMVGGDSGVPNDNWSQFLDLVASVESTSWGGYEAYNLGGSAGGHLPHGSGNSTDGRFGKPLTQLTVREVMNLGQAPTGRHIWAAGRYQFIPGTLRETVAEAGINPDTTLFDAATQDRLAIARARWRMRVDRGMGGLRREWIGLNNVSDAVLRPAMQGILNDRSPFNKPEVLTPGVANKAYTQTK